MGYCIYNKHRPIAYAMNLSLIPQDNRPAALSPLCICGRLRRASRALTRTYDDALAPVGLTVTQFSILRTLDAMTHPSLAELADATAHEKSGLWRTLQPLIRSGAVVSAPIEGLRGARLTLTDEGRDLLQRALPLWTETQNTIGDALGDRREKLIALLTEVEALV